jgi:hypothetical protein
VSGAGGGERGGGAADRADRAALFATRWVHAYEEDDAAGAVYRPEDADLPLSRRPREGLALSADGSARVDLPGPDDRPRPRAAAWRDEGGEIVIAPTDAPGREWRVVAWSPDRLVVQRPPSAS